MLNNEKDRNWFLRCVFCVFVYNALVFICMYVCVCVCVYSRCRLFPFMVFYLGILLVSHNI